MRVLTRLKKLKPGRIIGGALGLLLVLTLIFALGSPALAFPQLAHRFDGSVTISGQPAPLGVEVSATIAGVDEVFTAETDAAGAYHLLYVRGDDLDTPDKEGGVNGDEIEFSVDDVYVTSYTFESGASDTLNLTITVVDTTAPTVTMTALAPDPTSDNTPTFTGTATDELSNIASVEYRVDNGAWVAADASDGAFDELSEDYSFTAAELLDGTYTVYVKATDTATNTTAEADYARDEFTIDVTAPVVVITSPLEGAVLNTLEVLIEGTATEVAEVTVYGSGVVPVVDGVFSITLIYDDEGAKSIPVTATDAAGNVGSDTVDFTIDVTAPVVTIDPVTSPTNTATKTLTGTMSVGLTVVLTSAEATVGAVTNPTDTTWSCDVTLVEGSNVITATADASIATATIDLDTAAPTVVSKSPAAGAPGVAVGTTVSVTFSEAMDASTITTSSFTLDSVSGSVSYSSGTYTFTPSDNLTLDTTYTATLSTAITDAVGNPLDEAYSWSFTTATASLGDVIAEAEPDEVVELGAGTYSGDITINIPMTIRGSEEGTTISGGIHVAPLTGSNFTIENVTIIDYTEYGIWIELVGADDVFTIRNNTIEGLEGDVIGIQVDEVEAGGTLDIWQNTISGNETGIKLLEDVFEAAIQFNDIVGNEVGLELLRADHQVGASLNWWGDISGPEEGSENPGGTGNKIELADGLGYYPWLTREFQTVLDDNICYFGYPMGWLYPGWNIMSTPIALDPLVEWVDSEGTSRTGVNTWGDYTALGDGLDIHDTNPAYSFDGENQVWVPLTDDSLLKPCDAIYVRMASDDIAAILYSPTYSVPSKDLYSGWNLISLGWLDPEVYSMPVDEALVTVEEVTGDLTGYKLVVSPNVNAWESPWIYIAGDPSPTPPDGWMTITSGYWVFMLNNGTLAGFTFTPVSLPVQPGGD